MRIGPAVFCPLIAVVGLGVLPPAQAGTTLEFTAVFDNRGTPSQRYWLEYRPDGLDPARPYPIVIVLHPGASTPASIQSSSGWDAIADEYHLIILYPAGNEGTLPAPSQWNIWDFEGAPDTILPPQVRNRDDAGFLDQLIERTVSREEFAGHTARIYMTGFSSGAQMTSSYAGTGRTNVAAFGPVSGGWCAQCGVPETFFRPSCPTLVWYWRGERESSLTPCGFSRDVHDAAQRAFWIEFNGVIPTPALETREVLAANPSTGQPILVTHVTEIFTGGQAEFRYTVVQRSGHVYQPGAARRLWEEFFSRFAGPLSFADFELAAPCLNGPDTPNSDCNQADFDRADVDDDGDFDLADFVRFQLAIGTQCP